MATTARLAGAPLVRLFAPGVPLVTAPARDKWRVARPTGVVTPTPSSVTSSPTRGKYLLLPAQPCMLAPSVALVYPLSRVSSTSCLVHLAVGSISHASAGAIPRVLPLGTNPQAMTGEGLRHHGLGVAAAAAGLGVGDGVGVGGAMRSVLGVVESSSGERGDWVKSKSAVRSPRALTFSRTVGRGSGRPSVLGLRRCPPMKSSSMNFRYASKLSV